MRGAVGAERHAVHRVGVAGQRRRRSVGRCRRPTAAPCCRQLPEAMRVPSGLNATLDTASVWPVSGSPMGWPVSASHSRTVLSSLPEAMPVPVGAERHADHRVGVAGERVADGLAGVGVPQPHRVVVTAGDDAGAVGAERHAVTPRRCGRSAAAPTGWPVSASHSRTVLSSLPETMRVPVGAERHAGHRVGVAGERLADGLAGVGVPQPHRVVVTAGGDAGARRG